MALAFGELLHALGIELTESDVTAVLQALGQCVCEELLDGNRVELAHLATFSLSLTCGNKKLEDCVTKYFEEPEFMQRRNFESVCECSRYTATKKLKELVKAGKLRAMGAKNVRFYVKGSL